MKLVALSTNLISIITIPESLFQIASRFGNADEIRCLTSSNVSIISISLSTCVSCVSGSRASSLSVSVNWNAEVVYVDADIFVGCIILISCIANLLSIDNRDVCRFHGEGMVNGHIKTEKTSTLAQSLKSKDVLDH